MDANSTSEGGTKHLMDGQYQWTVLLMVPQTKAMYKPITDMSRNTVIIGSWQQSAKGTLSHHSVISVANLIKDKVDCLTLENIRY